ncbi:MAG TPA: hypothetical protein VF809_02800 [Candidatus Saccharimonadales bacterium]
MRQETRPLPEIPPAGVIFNEAYDTLDGLPEQDNNGLRVKNTGLFLFGIPGRQKVVAARDPSDNYQLGLTIQTIEDDNGVDERTITLGAVCIGGEVGYSDLGTVMYALDRDPRGEEFVSAQVVTPGLRILTDADWHFLSAVGMSGAIEQADHFDGIAEACHGDYMAQPEEVVGLPLLPETVINYRP